MELDAVLKLCEGRGAERPTSDIECAKKEMLTVHVRPRSQIFTIGERFNLVFLSDGVRSDENLIDFFWPYPQIYELKKFIIETWELPDRMIPITTFEGEGGYLYDVESDKIWNFSLRHRKEFLSGSYDPMFGNFYEFIFWYLGGVGPEPGNRSDPDRIFQ